jgi:hypothetical protein
VTSDQTGVWRDKDAHVDELDPMTAVYEPNHEEYFKVHHEDLTLDSFKELAKKTYRTVSYRKQ